ncbi:hypothetical protein LAZ67_4001582 [Cordylochernes scorpioides]|uniref:Reverse transcriptase domain-containing protein n=1 Tax=Cordylochernes scorpioides TaxID=51811 RepID=A0ABY6KC23_9ARAC|nr:hypothetical protein LAZ67_4001582 [Cordylochernes scorpioides]
MQMVIKIDSNLDGMKLESSTPCTFKKYKWASEKETTFIQNLVAIQGSWNSPIKMLTNNFTNQIRSAMHTAGMQVVITPDGPKSKPWFDRECYLTKKSLNSQLKFYIRSNSEGDRKAYALLKKKYSSLLTGKKKTYYAKIQERLKEMNKTLGNISIQKWQQFYTELLATSPPVKYDWPIRVILMPDDELMAEISLSEITGEIAYLKRNKACGLDNIPNEAIKALPPASLTALKYIYNRVLKTGQFPTTWCKTIIHPIFKNGDADNPHNYRGIALLSNLAKLFSSIMKIRLSNWTENRAIIQENQAGFRKEHSCQDHIFTLVSLIQLTLRRKRRKFYAFFIDLKKAFDTVPQALLWKKLLDIGLNFIFINLIKNYYENMTAAVRWNNSLTEFIKIKSGVLQDPDSLTSAEYVENPDKKFSEFLGGPGKRFSEFLGGPGKRFSEFLGGPGKRFSEFLGGPGKRFSEFLGGPGKRYSEFLGGPGKRFSEFLGGPGKRYSEFLGGPGKRFSEFLGGPGKRYSEFLGGPGKRFSEFLGGPGKRFSEFLGGPGKRSIEPLYLDDKNPME